MAAQTDPPLKRGSVRKAITAAWLQDEHALVTELLRHLDTSPQQKQEIELRAAGWVRELRKGDSAHHPLDDFLREYDLSSKEGVVLMCLAEALLRIPDAATAETLIADKLGSAAWRMHLGQSESALVNASTWSLMLTGRLLADQGKPPSDLLSALRRMAGRAGEPVIRLALRRAMHLLANQFVMGRTIQSALKRSASAAHARNRHSFDMLGEAALNADDAQHYLQAYGHAIEAIGNHSQKRGPLPVRPGISVKLSALHPRFEFTQASRVRRELTPHLLQLALLAKQHHIALTVDAEECDRLELTLDVFDAVYRDERLAGWNGLGLAVQAFHKRALPLIDWLHECAGQNQRVLQVRLVKGAYWDTEIKRAQEQGLRDYPVFTQKARTDLSYLACSKRLLQARDRFYPMLATHNAHSIAAVLAFAGDDMQGFEFQRLHGMGEALYSEALKQIPLPCRVYAPVGSHEDLLPYLVRRLLENGANSSFIHRLYDARLEPEALTRDPGEAVVNQEEALRRPTELFAPDRKNARGVHLADEQVSDSLRCALSRTEPDHKPLETTSIVDRLPIENASVSALESPTDSRRVIAKWAAFEPSAGSALIGRAREGFDRWQETTVDHRARLLTRAADQLEKDELPWLRLLVTEAGKTLPDAISEWRESIDFLRYYAQQAATLMRSAQKLPGPNGEDNQLSYAARGVFVCISPWNFPLSIFCGQIAAALVTGNSVVAKPAEQTPLIALRLCQLMHEIGVPRSVLQCVLGDGHLGAALTADPGISGVVFTGSFEVAKKIHRALAAREGAIPVFVAETGGQNVMIADSSALQEQLVRDAMRSAFGSAGQRCSALRLLYLQQEIADPVIKMMRGAMRELKVGDPARLDTDIGPIIDREALRQLRSHRDALHRKHQLLEQIDLPESCAHGHFFAPCLAQIDGIQALESEHFGPILHVARFAAGQIDALLDQINEAGFGLTLGVHSRIESRWRQIATRARVGNIYINRAMTGAVVGSQPFGGEGLSGTGPKAGGPNYLRRFVTERALSINTSAMGGDPELLGKSAQRDP